MTTLSCHGLLSLNVYAADGSLRESCAVHNRVLSAGRAHVADSLLGVVRNQGFRLALGSSAEHKEDQKLETLHAPALEVAVEKVSDKDGSVLLRAAVVSEEDLSIAESGVIIIHERGSSRAKRQVLYNRAVLAKALTIKRGETLDVSWSLSFVPA